MKRNIPFFTIVISSLLISSNVLAGCMYAITADHGKTKDYVLNGQSNTSGDNTVIEDAPLAQSEMQKKFGVYLHEEARNTVTVFSEGQYAQLKEIRENGERIPLTYDEVLFLVNDAINLYFKYDRIVLTDAVVDRILLHTLAVPLSSNAYVIYPYHGDFSEYAEYSAAYQAYQKMLQEIYAIIYYRIYVHDAGFAAIFHVAHGGKEIVHGENSVYYKMSSPVPLRAMQMLALDDSTVGGLDNENKLVKEYEKVVDQEQAFLSDWIDPDRVLPTLDAPLLFTDLINPQKESILYEFWIYLPDRQSQKIYPTAELTERMPHQESCYAAKTEGNDNAPVSESYPYQPHLSLMEETGEFCMASDISVSFSITGKYDNHDGILKLYPDNVGEQGVYSYVLVKKDGCYVYSAENSKPIDAPGYDWPDGLIFEKVWEGWRQ